MNPIKEFSLKELKPLITLYFRELFNFIMKKKPYIYLICILLYFTVLSPHSYASETLRDIHADISILQGQKIELQNSWDNFRNEHGNITDFIKTNLSPQERVSLSSLLNRYLEDIRLNTNTIELRKNFFDSITPYIDISKYSLYEKYKEAGFRFEEEQKSINDQLQEKKELRDERTDLLKTYIADNALERRERIQSRIAPLLRDRLNIFTQNPGFQELTPERKVLVFGRILSKIQEQRSFLETSGLETSVVLDRIETYGVIESIMQEYIDTWR